MTNQEKALRIISDFLEEEYDSHGYLVYDLYRVPIAYTTDDEENALQVYADVMNYRLIYTKNGETVTTDDYGSYAEFESEALRRLDFDDLIANCNGTYMEV